MPVVSKLCRDACLTCSGIEAAEVVSTRQDFAMIARRAGIEVQVLLACFGLVADALPRRQWGLFLVLGHFMRPSPKAVRSLWPWRSGGFMCRHVQCQNLGMMRAENLRQTYAGRSVIEDYRFVCEYVAKFASHETDHNGSLCLSWEGIVCLPRAKFQKLRPLSQEVPDHWSPRQIVAAQLAMHHGCASILVSEIDGCCRLITPRGSWTVSAETINFASASMRGVVVQPKFDACISLVQLEAARADEKAMVEHENSEPPLSPSRTATEDLPAEAKAKTIRHCSLNVDGQAARAPALRAFEHSLDRAAVFKVMYAVPQNVEGVRRRLLEVAVEAANNHPESVKLYNSTLQEVFSLLMDFDRGFGATIVVAADKYQVNHAPADKGTLSRCYWTFASSILDNTQAFREIWNSSRTVNPENSWSQQQVDDLVRKLHPFSADAEHDADAGGGSGASRENLLQELPMRLAGEAKEGALWLTLSGAVRAAAAHLLHVPNHTRVGVDGAGGAALAIAESMGLGKALGAIFVKTDVGSLHVILPQPCRPVPPHVLDVILPKPNFGRVVVHAPWAGRSACISASAAAETSAMAVRP